MNALSVILKEVSNLKGIGPLKSLPGKALRPHPKPKSASVKNQGGGINIMVLKQVKNHNYGNSNNQS